MAAELGETTIASKDNFTLQGRVENNQEQQQRGKAATICPDHFSCSKLMKIVSSLLLHRSSHYGSYDLIASASNAAADDLTFGGRRFGKQKSEPGWAAASVGVAHGGFDHSKSNILTFSISENDLKLADLHRRKSGRCKQNGHNRRSLDTDEGAKGNNFNGVLLKRVVFTSADNLPFSIVTRSIVEEINGPYGNLTDEVFRLTEFGNSKGCDSLVRVHNLRVANEFGGILDPDDCLLAVVEDKEQIVAIYDEQEPTTSTSPLHEKNGINSKTNGHFGFVNGKTSSSQSADISIKSADSRIYIQAPAPPSIPARFRASRERRNHVAVPPSSSSSTIVEKNSVLVSEPTAATTSNLLVVRRGSEPVLNAGNYDDEVTTPTKNGGAGTVKKRVEFLNAEQKHRHDDDIAGMNDNATSGSTGRFARTAARKSRLTDEWLEVAAQAAEDYRAKKIDDVRLEDDVYETIYLRLNPPQINDDIRSSAWSKVAFEFEPEYENDHRRVLKALIVKKMPVNWDSSVDTNEKLRIGDGIVDLNGRSVAEMSFEKAIDHFHHLIGIGQHLNLIVHRFPTPKSDQYQPPLPVYPTSQNDSHLMPTSTTTAKQTDGTVKSTSSAPMAALQKGNTRRIGQRLKIDLKKQPPPDGFGFTLTSRDNEFTTSPNSETGSTETLVYVKTISPSGAAIEDGRLKAGDRLLEVNGQKLNKDFGQPDVVRLLRQVKPGEIINLTVSRQATVTVGEEQDTIMEKRISPALPRPLKDESGEEEKIGKKSYDQMLLTFDIPLNDTGSAGLGVSVKGRMAPGEGSQRKDGGIFVKTILHGGAVHKDGRLRVNDRVIAVDGVDLSGLSNSDAMQRLRSVMMDLKPTAQSIHLTILRIVPIKEKETDGEETMSNGGVKGLSDGGRHRLLVNENSTNGSLASRNVFYYGDDDYAMIVKNSRPPMSNYGNFVNQWPHSEDDEPPVMIEWSDTPAAAASHRQLQPSRSDSTGSSWTCDRLSRRDNDEDGSVEALFVRDAPTRRSMSEKRHGAAKNDPSSTSTFQKIQHQRQTSAPSLQRRPIGGGSLINTTSKQEMKQRKIVSQSPPPLTVDRRSMSLESVNKNQEINDEKTKMEKPLLHEEVAQSLQKTNNKTSFISSSGGVKWLKTKSAANRQRPTNESFRQAVDKSYMGDGQEVGVDVYGDSSEPLGEPHYAQISHSTTADSIATNRSRPVNKEKDRRKSTGSGLSLKNLFRFGSGGKANRPFAVVSPVNNESKLDDDENEYDTYAKVNKKDKDHHERQKSQDSRIRNNNQEENWKQQKINQEYERQMQTEAQAIAKKRHDEEQMRIRQHFERLKGQQSKQQNNSMTTVIVGSTKSSSAGSNSPKISYPPQPKMPTQWRPPIPAPSPPQQPRMIRTQPVMGREMVAQAQHSRQHSAGGSTNSGSHMQHSPAGSGQYHIRQQPQFDYYAQGQSGYYHQYQPTTTGHNYGVGYSEGNDQMQGANNRHRGTNNNSPSRLATISPPPQSSWFEGGASSARHHRFYYSSMDGRPSERTGMVKNNGVHQSTTNPYTKESLSASQLTNVARARCTSEHVDNWSAASQSTSSAAAGKRQQAPIVLIGDGTSNRHQRNGHQHEQSSPRQQPYRVRSPEVNRTEEERHRVIIGSIPIFDSRKNDGVTRIVIDHQNSGQQPPPPPPDYEQYLRSRHAKKGLTSTVIQQHQARPCSEFIGEDTTSGRRYESSSLPRKGGKKSHDDVDVIMATPPARNVHYFYHPQQQLK